MWSVNGFNETSWWDKDVTRMEVEISDLVLKVKNHSKSCQSRGLMLPEKYM